jgi:hypothetical protein
MSKVASISSELASLSRTGQIRLNLEELVIGDVALLFSQSSDSNKWVVVSFNIPQPTHFLLTFLLTPSTPKEFLALCDALLAELRSLEPASTQGAAGSSPSDTLEAVFGSLQGQPLFFNVHSEHVHFKLVHFLCSQIKVRHLPPKRMKDDLILSGEICRSTSY